MGWRKLLLHMHDHRLPQIDFKLKLVLQRRLRCVHKRKIDFHLLHQILHTDNIGPQVVHLLLTHAWRWRCYGWGAADRAFWAMSPAAAKQSAKNKIAALNIIRF